MKKLFLAGALALSMAVSSPAFATVNYGQNDTLAVTYDDQANTVSVSAENDLASYGDQVTVIVVDTDGTIAAENILYIDQTAAANAADDFTGMGLLLDALSEEAGEELTSLPVGEYYVKVGGTNITSILVGTIVVTAESEVTYEPIVLGDINNDGNATTADAMGIINYVINSLNNGSDNKYQIGQTLKVSASENLVVGDINNDGNATTADAMGIINYVINSLNNGSDNKYQIGQQVNIVVEE